MTLMMVMNLGFAWGPPAAPVNKAKFAVNANSTLQPANAQPVLK